MRNVIPESTNKLLAMSDKIREQLGEEAMNCIHVFLAFTLIDEFKEKDILNSYNITYEVLSEGLGLFDLNKEELLNSIDLNKTKFNMSHDVAFMIRGCAIKNGTESTIQTVDILISMLERDDLLEMKAIASTVDEDRRSILKDLYRLRKINSEIEYNRLLKLSAERRMKEDASDVLKKDLENARARRQAEMGEKGQSPFLDKYGKNLLNYAKDSKLEKIVGRDKETEKLIEVLGRKKKNNPCLIGEPGVGKTAIVEDLAIRISKGKVPDFLKPYTIYSLDLGLVISGSKYRGDFEGRIEGIIKEVLENGNIILFIDEIHTLLEAGNSEGSMGAGDILKPYLARGDIRCIGATTLEEYTKYIEKDGALERRFQKVNVEEPSIDACISMITSSKSSYEKYHNVTISKDAIESAVKLSNRCILDRFLPDKAFDLLDTACSKVKIKGKKKTVSKADIANVLYELTGIPADELLKEGSKKILGLKKHLNDTVIGQDKAIETINKAVLRSYAGLRNTDKPIASLIFTGPTGVGKTYLAKQICEYMFYSADNLIRLDMSEYMDKSSVSKLIGSAPGYVGYGENAILSREVRNKPYSILLIDEMEKAHPDVMNIFLQILDNGRITDSQGRKIDFRNTILIFTSNLYNPNKSKRTIGFPASNAKEEATNYKEEATKLFTSQFSLELVNRFDDIVVFESLTKEGISSIFKIAIDDLNKVLSDKDIAIRLSPSAEDFIISKCDYKQMGARTLTRAISKYIEDGLVHTILELEDSESTCILVDLDGDELTFEPVQLEIINRNTVTV